MARRKPRRLHPDEIDLWNKVVEKAVALHPHRSARLPEPSPEKPLSLSVRHELKNHGFRVGERAKTLTPTHNLAPNLSEQLASQPLAIDRKRFNKLKKGRLNPEARIDLHGLTIAEAHPALTRFIFEAVSDGLRLVLVITGKGKTKDDTGPIPERHGVLRHQVPHWLHTAPLRAHVLQISEAHIRHGGQGAYYVYLKRPRQGM